LLCLQLLFQERFTDRIIRVHQHTQLFTDVGKYIVRVGLGYLLHPLHFRVVLLLLCWCRVGYLLVLRLQIIQHILDFPCRAFNLLVERNAFLDRSNGGIGSSQ
jgi:hypothetical protein